MPRVYCISMCISYCLQPVSFVSESNQLCLRYFDPIICSLTTNENYARGYPTEVPAKPKSQQMKHITFVVLCADSQQCWCARSQIQLQSSSCQTGNVFLLKGSQQRVTLCDADIQALSSEVSHLPDSLSLARDAVLQPPCLTVVLRMKVLAHASVRVMKTIAYRRMASTFWKAMTCCTSFVTVP